MERQWSAASGRTSVQSGLAHGRMALCGCHDVRTPAAAGRSHSDMARRAAPQTNGVYMYDRRIPPALVPLYPTAAALLDAGIYGLPAQLPGRCASCGRERLQRGSGVGRCW